VQICIYVTMLVLDIIANHATFTYNNKTHVLSSDRPFVATIHLFSFQIRTHSWEEQLLLGPKENESQSDFAIPEIGRHEPGKYSGIYSVRLLDPFDTINLFGFGIFEGFFRYVCSINMNDIEQLSAKKGRRVAKRLHFIRIDSYSNKVAIEKTQHA
jgi:hypothetical protein